MVERAKLAENLTPGEQIPARGRRSKHCDEAVGDGRALRDLLQT